MLYYVIAFILVALFFNMANRNLKRKKQDGRKSYREALSDWEAFKKKHPGSGPKKDEG